jgi:hypothetical protein
MAWIKEIQCYGKSTVDTQDNNYYSKIKKEFVQFKWAIFYQSGPLDLPPGGWNTRTLVCTP